MYLVLCELDVLLGRFRNLCSIHNRELKDS